VTPDACANLTLTVNDCGKLSTTSGGNWSNANTWLPSGVPGTSDNTTIISPGTVIVDINNATCNDMTIEEGAKLEISASQALTVTGNLVNNAGTSGLVVKSDAANTGSLIHQNTNIEATFERVLLDSDFTNWKDGWHFLSSPVASQAISTAFTVTSADEYDFYTWYEPQNLWVNFKNTTEAPTWNTANGSTNFVVGKGYMAAYDEADIKIFSGDMNVGNVVVSGITLSAPNHGWHLLGNPFGSALTWDASGSWSLVNIAGVAKIWNESNQSYTDITSSPSSIIPAGNGFMVQVSSGTGSLVIPADKRLHNSTPFYKTQPGGITLKAISMDENNAQECRILVNPQSTGGYDVMYDSRWLEGFAPQFYSIFEDQKLSTNSIPEITGQTAITFGFIKNTGSAFQIEASGAETFEDGAYLQDLKTGTITDLSKNPVYSFTSESEDNPNRFVLKFSLQSQESPIEITAYVNNSTLYLQNTEGEVTLGIFGITGQKILEVTTTGNAVALGNLATGVYILKITSNQKVKESKIFIY